MWVWACPPAIWFVYPALVANFLVTPLFTSWMQVAMADQLGRRVAPWRKPMVAGVLTLLAGFACLPLVQLAGGALGLVAGTAFGGLSVVSALAQGADASGALAAAATFAFAGAFVGMAAVSLPAIAAAIGGTSLVQLIVMLRESHARPLGTEARMPSLWGDNEERPGFLGWLPPDLVGGHGPDGRMDEDAQHQDAAAQPAQERPPPDAPASAAAPESRPASLPSTLLEPESQGLQQEASQPPAASAPVGEPGADP